MKFLNSMDIDYALARLGERDDNLGSAVRILAALRNDVDACSDGWAHWSVPVRAARQLIALVERGTDVHATELRKALSPIRAFYTRAHRGDYGGPVPAKNRWLE
jgi:hypothetical protein